MIPTQTLESYPVFGDNATKIQPDGAKYSNGFIEGDVYPAEWVNWAWNKNTKGITDANAGISSMEAEINAVLTNAGKTPDVSESNQLLLSIQKLISDAETRAKLAAHPVGSLYWSSQSTDPSELFGGTWVRIKDRFIWAAGDSDTINETGGAKTVTLEVTNLPAHTHSVGAHAHGLNSHTHTLSHTHTINNGNTSSSGTTQTAGFRGVSSTTGSQSTSTTGSGGAHTHYVLAYSSTRSGAQWYPTTSDGTANRCAVFGGFGNAINKEKSSSTNTNTSQRVSWNPPTFTGDGAGTYDLRTDTSYTHTHSYSHTHGVTASGYLYGKTDGASATTTSQATGNTANSSAFDSGSTGSGTAVNKMPPYQIKYCWERTA